MNSWIAIKRARNPWVAALLLVALCSRALIPAGFMPGPGGLILCQGMAIMDMAGMDMAGAAHHGSQPSHEHGSPYHEHSSLCPFAAAATTMAIISPAAYAVAAGITNGSVRLPEQPVVPRGTIVPTRLPRGPPAVA